MNDVHVLSDANGVGGTEAWPSESPTGTPPSVRYGHTAVYDSTNNLMIVFGGNNCGSSYYNDLWVLSNANGLGGTPAWSQLTPSGVPPAARAFASAVYDAADNRMVVFGGSNGTLFGDVWMLRNANGKSGAPVWLQLKPSGTPPAARSGHSAVFDPASKRMIVYGGSSATAGFLGDTWVLSGLGGGTPAWTLTVPQSASSPQRSLHSAVYAAASNQMIIFGGKLPRIVTGNPSDDHALVLNNANGL